MSTSDNSAAPSVGLGTHSSRGLMYFFAGTSAAKLVNFLGQLILTRLLSPDAFGIVGLAYSITIFIQVIEQAGVGDLLVQRRRFARWALPAFWLALSLGLLSTLLVALAGPITARFLENNQYLWVLLILAPSSIPNSLSVVPRAQLTRQLRFRALAAINLVNFALRMVLAVLFAAIIHWKGLKQLEPLAFVLPVPIVSTLIAVFLWWWVRPPWSPNPYFRRWRHLFGDSTRLLVAEIYRVVLDQSDYMLMGLFRRPAELIGIYWCGFAFSIQMLQLFMFNLMNVLFPALTRLSDRPQAQFQGFMKAQRILAMVGVGSCFLQAACAAPLTHLLLDDRWVEAIGVMQILGLGMATKMVGGSSYALLKSQGRFRTILWTRTIFVSLQVVGLVIVLSLGGGILSVALVVAVVASMIGPATFYAAITPYGAGWQDVGKVLLPPLVLGGAAVGAGWLAAQGLVRMGYGYLPQLAATTVVSVLLGVLFARTWMRPVWNDLWARAWRLLPARYVA